MIWLNFDLRAGAETYDYQLVAGSLDMAWALYYSNEHQNGVNSSGLSGDCSDLVLWQCGVTFNGWATMTAPPFAETKNIYLAIWDMDCSKPSKYNFSRFDLNAFKARNGCSNFTCPDIALAFTSTETNCISSCNGRAEVSATGGQSPYSYSWSNGSLEASTDGLCAGQHSVTVTDANGCSAARQVNIADLGIPSVTLTAINNTSCSGWCNGEVRVTVDCIDVPYYIVWNLESDAPVITGLCAGTYEVSIIDINGNEYTNEIILIDEMACKHSFSQTIAKDTGSGLFVNAYPNPFLHDATLEFRVQREQKVVAELLAADGRRVALLFDGLANEAETYAFKLNGDDLTAGMYLFRLITNDGRVQVTKLSLLK